MTLWSLHPETRPDRSDPPRLSDSSKLGMAIMELDRIRRAIAEGILEAGPTGKLRKLSLRARDAKMLDWIDRTVAELRRGRT